MKAEIYEACNDLEKAELHYRMVYDVYHDPDDLEKLSEFIRKRTEIESQQTGQFPMEVKTLDNHTVLAVQRSGTSSAASRRRRRKKRAAFVSYDDFIASMT